jgi:GNAT superfamily N-acetyltransferase
MPGGRIDFQKQGDLVDVEDIQIPAASVEAFDLRQGAVDPFVVEGVQFVRYHEELAHALAKVMDVAVETVYDRDAGGVQASVALVDGRVAGYGWVSHDMIRIHELRLAVPILPGHAYIWDCATMPEYRNRGIFSGLLRFILEDVRLQGDVQAWGIVAPGNQPSLHAFARAGFRLVARTRMWLGHVESEPTAEATAEEAAFLRALRTVDE